MSTVRTAISSMRSRLGLSQRQLAAMAGLRPDTVSALERGTSAGIRFDTLARLCEVLECAPGELLELEFDDHQVPILAGPEEDALIRERLRSDEPRVDGRTFLEELLQREGERQPARRPAS